MERVVAMLLLAVLVVRPAPARADPPAGEADVQLGAGVGGALLEDSVSGGPVLELQRRLGASPLWARLAGQLSLGIGGELTSTEAALVIGGVARSCRATGWLCGGVMVGAGPGRLEFDAGVTRRAVQLVLEADAFAEIGGGGNAFRVSVGARHTSFMSGDRADYPGGPGLHLMLAVVHRGGW